jgi:hypothetical protein
MVFRERCAAQTAAEALEPVAVLSKALAGNATLGAGRADLVFSERFHISIIQQALAVCQSYDSAKNVLITPNEKIALILNTLSN